MFNLRLKYDYRFKTHDLISKENNNRIGRIAYSRMDIIKEVMFFPMITTIIISTIFNNIYSGIVFGIIHLLIVLCSVLEKE